MSNGTPMNQYITPEQAAMMAGIEDPKDRMNTMGGMQAYANALPAMGRIKERDNGRVVGRTSAMEGIGQLGSQLAGAYMNKNLMDKYGAMMDKNNASRSQTALLIAQALRGAGQPGAAQAQPGSAQAFPVNMQNPAMSTPLPSGMTPYELDYYGG
jgi:hypothetical protein